MTSSLDQSTSATDDIILPFQVEEARVRGRLARIGPAIDAILTRHDYPDEVSILLGEAVALTAMLGAALKFDGRFILQTQTDGPVSMIVADYATPGHLRGYAAFDAARLDAARRNDAPKEALLDKGHLAMTIDQGAHMERHQGVVPLDGGTLAEAAHVYFRQSEQIPTRIHLAVAPAFTAKDGGATQSWRAGGLMIQHLTPEGGTGSSTLDEDDWRRAQILMETTHDHELLDPHLSPERLLYRLYHEDGVRVFKPHPVDFHCGCTRERIDTLLRNFSPQERANMIVGNKIAVTCEFCNARYHFDPAGFS